MRIREAEGERLEGYCNNINIILMLSHGADNDIQTRSHASCTGDKRRREGEGKRGRGRERDEERERGCIHETAFYIMKLADSAQFAASNVTEFKKAETLKEPHETE